MLTITKLAPDRVDIVLDGALDAESMRNGLDQLLADARDVVRGRMLYTIRTFAMPSFAALIVEASRFPQLLALLGKFDRCAVLCDVGWIRTAAEVEGALMPGLRIKSFTLDEHVAAEAWLVVGQQDGATPTPPTP